VFQYYRQIFLASYLTREIVADSQRYDYKKIKEPILTNRAGIEDNEIYSVASPERALLDVIYLCTDYHFDNLAPINWDKVYDILPIYGSKGHMGKRVQRTYETVKLGKR
jgi:hypothetical protein